MRLNYVTLADERLPAYRYRMKLPGEYLGNYEITPYPVEADLHFLSKPYHSRKDILTLMLKKASKLRFVLDICDDIFERDSAVPEYMVKLSKFAAVVTVPTDEMGKRVKEETGIDAEIISDPCEFPQKEIKDISEPKVMWFGTHSNLVTLKNAYIECPLEILCSRCGYKAAKELGATFTEWSMENMSLAFERNNIVVVPSVGKKRQVKSPNRVSESIRSGLSVVAAPIPSYQQFDISLNWDMNEGLKNIKKTTPELQKYVNDNFDISVIGEKWKNLFGSILDVEGESLKTG